MPKTKHLPTKDTPEALLTLRIAVHRRTNNLDHELSPKMSEVFSSDGWEVVKGFAEALVPLLDAVEQDLKTLECNLDSPDMMRVEARVIVVRQLLGQHLEGLNRTPGGWEALVSRLSFGWLAFDMVFADNRLRDMTALIRGAMDRKSQSQDDRPDRKGSDAAAPPAGDSSAPRAAMFTDDEAEELLGLIDQVSRTINILSHSGLPVGE